MASKYAAFKSFSAGEISPRMYARSDLPMYKEALALCENFNITPQGSAVMRRGWRFLAEGADSEFVRLETFSRALDEDIILELSDDDIRAYNSTGEIIVDIGLVAGPPIPVVKEMVSNGDFSGGYSNWTQQSSFVPPYSDYGHGIFNGWYRSTQAIIRNDTGVISVCHGIYQTVTKPAGNPQDNLARISFQVAFNPDNFAPNWHGSKPTNYWEVTVLTAIGGTVLQTKTGQTTGAQTLDPIDMAALDSVVLQLRAYNIDTGGNGVDFYYATEFSGISCKFTILEDQQAPGTIPWTREMLPFIQTQMVTGQDAMVLTERRMAPHYIAYDAAQNRLGLSLAPLVGTPAWNATTGWPAVCEIFQGRLWLMGTKQDPSGVWGSQSGDYFNFNTGTGLPNEGLDLPLSTRGVIQWAVGQKETLSVGTDLNEEQLGSDGPIILPSDASTTPVSSYGSAPIQARIIGDQIAFISTDARKLLMSNFDDRIQNWVAVDLSLAAEHLMANQIIRFIDVRNPNYQIACHTKDGYWIQCMYDRALNVLAWQRNTMGGRIISMCKSRSLNGDLVWAAIRVNDRTVICRLEAPTEDGAYLDFYVRRFPKEDANGWYIDDIQHLARLIVTVVLDEAVVENVRVDDSGVARLPRGGDAAVIGIPYRAVLKTLPEEPPSQNGESLSGGKKRNADITVRIIDSAMPLINGDRPADRSPQTPMNEREPNITQDINVRSLGWDGVGVITIEQDKPLRTEIAGIFTKLGVNRT